MEPLPRRMRERIVALYEQGVPTRRIADGLGTSRSGTGGRGGRRADRGPLAGEARPGAQKKSLWAAEQDRPDVKAARDAWHDTPAGVPADKLVFVDESGARTNMTRLYGWGEVGERVVDPVPHGHWKTCTMLAAVRSSGPLAAVTIDAAVNADAFVLWTQQVLAPCLSPGDVVVMDDLPAHKAPGVAEAVEAAGVTLRYLPP